MEKPSLTSTHQEKIKPQLWLAIRLRLLLYQRLNPPVQQRQQDCYCGVSTHKINHAAAAVEHEHQGCDQKEKHG